MLLRWFLFLMIICHDFGELSREIGGCSLSCSCCEWLRKWEIYLKCGREKLFRRRISWCEMIRWLIHWCSQLTRSGDTRFHWWFLLLIVIILRFLLMIAVTTMTWFILYLRRKFLRELRLEVVVNIIIIMIAAALQLLLLFALQAGESVWKLQRFKDWR